MNELDMIKLNIFEAYDNGELSYGEKEYLLEQVDLMYERDAISRHLDPNRKDKNKFMKQGKSENEISPYSKAKTAARQRLENDPKFGTDKFDSYAKGENEYYKARGIKNADGSQYKIGSTMAYSKNIVETGKRGTNALGDRHNNNPYDKSRHDYREYIRKTAEPTARQQRIQELRKKNGFTTESTFETLLESINDLY